MNSVWTEKVTTNRIEEERKDFDEFGAFVRNERLPVEGSLSLNFDEVRFDFFLVV